MSESTDFFAGARAVLNAVPAEPTLAQAQIAIANVVLAMTGKILVELGPKHICLDKHVGGQGTFLVRPESPVVEVLRGVLQLRSEPESPNL